MTGGMAMQTYVAAIGLLMGAADAARAPTREQAVQQTLAAVRQELRQHGGSWQKWAEAIQPYRDDICGYVNDAHAYKWPWPAKEGYVFQGAAVQLHLRDELEDLPEGERPLESILHLDRQLRALGTDLIVAFIPSKLSVHPDCLYAAAQGEPQRPVRAPEDRQVPLAVKRLMCRLLEGGVEVVDLHEAFRQFRIAHGDGVPLYYVRDSHFLNRGARLAAGQIAERLRRYDFVKAALAAGNPYAGEKGSRTDGTKADDDLLLIRDRRTGEFYRDARDSPVVVAGDSHLLYNDGKAQVTAQIAHQIGLPVSRLGREGLSGDIPAQLARDPMLRRRRVVVLLYSERTLAPRAGKSKWPIVDLPGAAAKAGEPLPADRIRDVPATCVVVEASPPPDTKAPYRHHVMKLYVKGLTDQAGRPVGAGDGVLHVLAMHNRKVLAVAKAAAGSRLSVRLTAWPLVEGTYGAIRTGTLPSLDLELDKPSYWAEVPGEPRLTAEELGRIGEEDTPEARAPATRPAP